jgi:signal transduction histidine kinase
LKNLPHIGILLLLALAGCRKTIPVRPVDPWADYRIAYNFLNKNTDSAFYYFNKLATSSADKQQVAAAYQSMAFIQSNAGDTYGSQESLIASLKSLDERRVEDHDYLARDYNGLGMSYADLSLYGQALTYYQQALRFAGDSDLKANILNNQGNAHKNSKAYAKALSSYSQAILLTGNNGPTFARVLTNQATGEWLQNPQYDPVPDLLRSLTIRIREKDQTGVNSSYAHLADYYIKTNPDSARSYALKLLASARQLQNGDDQLYALRKLIVLSRPAQAKSYFERYQIIQDSLETKRNAAKNQFAVIRYNLERSKTENLELQKSNTEKRYQLTAVLVATAIAALFGLWSYRKRKQRIQLQADQEIQKSKLQFSQKVHDQIANGIYRIMSEVEHSPEVQKEGLLDQLDAMYEVSRNIAHEEDEFTGDFSGRIELLLNAFKKPAIRLAVTGNEPELWKLIDASVKKQLEIVLQELMVNMNKHSKATQAFVGFALEGHLLKIAYRDNGVGLAGKKKTGKGLMNTVSRIEALNGRVKFGNEAQSGFNIHIEVPLG